MAKVRTYSLDALQKIRKELKKQEQPKRHRELSTRAAILELKPVLDEKLAAGWTWVDLAESLSEAGLPIAPKTLKEYLETGHEPSSEWNPMHKKRHAGPLWRLNRRHGSMKPPLPRRALKRHRRASWL